MAEERITLLTAREAAEYLRVSLYTLNKIEKEGRLVPFRTPGGHRRYSLEMLNDYLESSRFLYGPAAQAAAAASKAAASVGGDGSGVEAREPRPARAEKAEREPEEAPAEEPEPELAQAEVA